MARVAIIEDETLIALSYRLILEKHGHEVCHMARNGEQLLLRMDEIAPDVVIMDIQLQGNVNGLDLTKQLRSIREVPVLLATGNSALDTAKLTEGMSKTLLRSKPLEREALLAGISELVD